MDMPICIYGEDQSIFDNLDAVFMGKKMSWNNMVTFTSDTCNTMV